MSPRVAALIEQEWYVDRHTGTRWRILALHEQTVDVVDSWGNRTTHNRFMWENGDMRPVDGPDPDAVIPKPRPRRTPV